MTTQFINKNKKTVFVGVSGGVDSSVAAALLKEQGYSVVGVFIRTWQPDWIECTWRDERRDAMRVCAHLNIPFVELDLEYEYKTGVAEYMIREYQAGRTPNPDVMCNREVKFGGFLRWALDHGADYVATGHYAQRKELSSGVIELSRGNDTQKDQSYFIWTLEQEQLRHILFPVGDIPKSRVRKLAQKFQLPTAVKKDSQGICFIGEIDMKDFLRHYIEEIPGDVCNEKGERIGKHNGVLFYTIGERHGFVINKKGTDDKPYYVTKKDIQKNILYVTQDIESLSSPLMYNLSSVVDNQNSLKKGEVIDVQIRYRGEVKRAEILSVDKNQKTACIKLLETDPSVAPGQSVVFYRENVCLGGGIVNE
jgi:tRNA-uridine 2-sulfurtransferase